MPKVPHLPMKRLPTYEIYASFAPGVIEEINAIRAKYDHKPNYPRDIGIRLIRDIIKNDYTEKALNESLPRIASSIAPFKVDFQKPFRNMSAEERKYPASVFYQINKSPFNIICADLRIMLNGLKFERKDRPQVTKSYKIGITGELDTYEESDRIVRELAEREKPKDILFDSFILATRPNDKPLSVLDQVSTVFPFKASEETFQIYIQNITAMRDEFVREKNEKIERAKKEKEAKVSAIIKDTDTKPEEALENKENSEESEIAKALKAEEDCLKT